MTKCGVQRVGPLLPVPGLLRSMGVDPAELLVQAGLRPDALDDPAGAIPFAAAANFLQRCAAVTACPQFGLFAGQLVTLRHLDPIGELMQSAPDLGTALLDFVTNQQRNARGAVTYLSVQGEWATFGYAVYQPGLTALDQVMDMAMSAGCAMLRELAEIVPHTMLLAHRRPPDEAAYRRLVTTKVVFDAEQTALLLPRRVLDQKLASADAVARNRLLARVAAFWAVPEPQLAARVLRFLRPRVVLGAPSVEETAEAFGMRPRTLNRLLTAESTNFRALLTLARLETARQLLRGTRLPVTQIALALGYAQHSDFTRAFRRGTGMTPSELRASEPPIDD